MRRGKSPAVAAETAINRITRHYPNFFGAIIVLNNQGKFAAACNGMPSFPFYVADPHLPNGPELLTVECKTRNVHCHKKDANCSFASN